MDIAQRFAANQLKTKYNPAFLNHLFNEWERNIEDMYYLHYPKMFIDPYTSQLSYESNHIEDLALCIIAEREKLHKYKCNAKHSLKMFYSILSKYTDLEQRQIKRFQRENILIDDELLERFCTDLLSINNVTTDIETETNILQTT